MRLTASLRKETHEESDQEKVKTTGHGLYFIKNGTTYSDRALLYQKTPFLDDHPEDFTKAIESYNQALTYLIHEPNVASTTYLYKVATYGHTEEYQKALETAQEWHAFIEKHFEGEAKYEHLPYAILVQGKMHEYLQDASTAISFYEEELGVLEKEAADDKESKAYKLLQKEIRKAISKIEHNEAREEMQRLQRQIEYFF